MTDSLANEELNDISSQKEHLCTLWEKASVPETYRLFFLAYLPYLTDKEKQCFLQKQIKQAQAESNYYCDLVEQYQNRKKVLIKLRNMLEEETIKDNLTFPYLSEIIQFLSQLRNANLIIIERLVNINRQCLGQTRVAPDYVKKKLWEFDSENNFLRESLLNKFVLFGQEYDPFFLYHYQHKNDKSVLMRNSIIEAFTNIEITFAARLRKIQQRSLRLINRNNNVQRPSFRRKYHSQNPSKKVSMTSLVEEGSVGAKASAQKFKIKPVFKQIGAQALKSVKMHIRQSIIKHQKIKLLTQHSNDDEELEYSTHNKSINYRIFQHSKTRFSQVLIKPDLPQKQDTPTKLPIYNFKQKLPAISNIQRDNWPLNSAVRLFNRPLAAPVLLQVPKVADQSDLRSTDDSLIRDIRMRASKISIQQLSNYLRGHSFKQQLNKQININNYAVSLFRNQSYLSQFLVNGQLKIIAVSIELPDRDYLIRIWHPVQQCSEYTSTFLFTKYTQYLQRAPCSKIYYHGTCQNVLISLNFTKIRQELFVKDRASRKREIDDEYPQFLSFKCSNILFPQQNTTINMLYSDEIETFNEDNYYIQPTIAAIDRANINPDLLLLAKINDQIKDMKALNCLLEDEKLDTFAITSATNIGQISAIRISSSIMFADYFVAGQGYFKFQGQQIYRQNKHLVCKVEGFDCNFSLLFGKGFSNIHKLIKKLRQTPNQAYKRRCDFSVKMFSKQLYGRMVNNSLRKCGYGNWEFSLSFKDQLQGRIKHNMQSSQKFGPEPFYFAIQMGSQILYCFQVKDDDFLY